jgi:hypothetical protein
VPSLTTMVVNGQTTVSTMMVQSTSLMRVAVSGGVTVALDAAATGSGGAGGTTEPPTSTKLVSGTVPPGASVSAYTSVDSHGSTVVIQTIVTSVPNSTAPEGDKSNLGAIIGGVVSRSRVAES